MIIAVYIDDLNLVGTPDTCNRAMSLLTTQFEMKLLGKTTFCLGLEEAGMKLLHKIVHL